VTVFLWGRPEEAVVKATAAALTSHGVDWLAADVSGISHFDIDRGLATIGERTFDLAEVSGVLIRPEATSNFEMYSLVAGWTELARARVVNRLSASASNASKPYQLQMVASHGFATPDTIVTTDPSDVRAFCAQHGRVIYKSTSGVRSIVALLNAGDEDRLAHVSACPTQFQQFIPGTDHRVHVVGEELFACRIDCAAIDYRYGGIAGHAVEISPVSLPTALVHQCLAMTETLGLELAGIDLRLDPDGRWWCFEVNTAPGFTWFEQHTRQPIAEAVARLLAQGRPRVKARPRMIGDCLATE
jgi:glutathione synthase/RimK-type ligase-like ATP-grasp enzyme